MRYRKVADNSMPVLHGSM